MDPGIDFEHEIEEALKARGNGNEGRARVCARRAAGAALRNYFSRKEVSVEGLSAYQLLLLFVNQPQIPPIAMQYADYLILQVSETFQLPEEVDLIHEARSLRDQLLRL
jgi:hypothetical protein